MHKIIINIGVAAYEQSNVVGERFSADDSNIYLTYVSKILTHFTFTMGVRETTFWKRFLRV